MNCLKSRPSRCRAAAVVLVAASLVSLLAVASVAAPSRQKTFSSPEAAVRALVEAMETDDDARLASIFGPGSERILASGDRVTDENDARRFLQRVRERCELVTRGSSWAAIQVGMRKIPFPIPLVKGADGWRFDTQAGEQEILHRRIGRNELHTVDFCHAFVDAQREYATRDRTGEGAQFARRILSDEGKCNGLYWPRQPGKPSSPLGPLVASADAEGYTKKAFHGYCFRVLTAQGPQAPGGAKSYLDGERMTRGFALVAWPVSYRNSGVMTFIVNQSGIVYQKDLGPKTAELAGQMPAFDPDPSWKPAKAR